MSLSRLYKTASTAAQEAKALAANINKQQMQITKETINQAKDRGKAEAAAREKAKQKSDLKADLDNARKKAVTGFVTGTLMKAAGMVAAGLNAKASRENEATQKGMKTLNKKEELKQKVDEKIKTLENKQANGGKLTKDEQKQLKVKAELTNAEGEGGEFSDLQKNIEGHKSLRKGDGKDSLTKAEKKLDDLQNKFDNATGANKASTKIDAKINDINKAMDVLARQGKKDSAEYKALETSKGALENLKKTAIEIEAKGNTDDVDVKKQLKEVNKAAAKEVGKVEKTLKDTKDLVDAETGVNEQKTKIDNDIADVDGKIGDLNKKIENASGPEKEKLQAELKGLTDLKDSLETTKGKLETAEKNLDKAIASGDKDAIKAAKKDVADVTKTADSLHAIVDEVSDINAKIDNIDQKVGKIDESIKSTKDQLDKLKADPTANPDEIKALTNKLDHLGKEKGALEETKAKLSDVRGKVAELGTKANEIVSKGGSQDDVNTALAGVGKSLGNLTKAADLIEDIGNKLAQIEKKLGELPENDPLVKKLNEAKDKLVTQRNAVEGAIKGGNLSGDEEDGLGKVVDAAKKKYDAITKGQEAVDGQDAEDGINDVVGADEDKAGHYKNWQLDIKESFLAKMLKYYNNGQIKDVIGDALTKATYKAIKNLTSRESAVHERVSALLVQMDMAKVAEKQGKVQDAQKKVQEAQSKYEKAMKQSGKLEKELKDAKQNLANLTGETDPGKQKDAVSNAESNIMAQARTNSDGETESYDEVVDRLRKEDPTNKDLAIVDAADGVKSAEKAVNSNNRDVSKSRETVNKESKKLASAQEDLDEALGTLEGSTAYLRGLYEMKYGSDRPDLGETGHVSLFGLDFKVDDDLRSMGKELIDSANSTISQGNATSQATRDLLLGAVGGAGSDLALDEKTSEAINKMLANGDKKRYEALKDGLDDLTALQKDTQDGKLGGGIFGKVTSNVMTMGIGLLPGIHTGIAGDPAANDKSVSFEDRRDALSDIINEYQNKTVNAGVAAVSSARDNANNYGGSDKDLKRIRHDVEGFVGSLQVGDKNNRTIEDAQKTLAELDGKGIEGIRGGGLLAVGGKLVTAEALGLDADAVKLNMMFNKSLAMQKKADLLNGANSGTESNAHLFVDPKFGGLTTASAEFMQKVEDRMADGTLDAQDLQDLKGEAETLLNKVDEALKQDGLSEEQKDSLKLQRQMLKDGIDNLTMLEKGPGSNASHKDRLAWENKVQETVGLLMGGSQQLNAKSVGEAGGWFGSTHLYGGRTVAESGEQKTRNGLRKEMMGMLADAQSLEATTPAEQKAKEDLINAIKEQMHQLDTYGRVDMTQVQTAMETYGETHAAAQGDAFDHSFAGVKQAMQALVTAGSDLAKGFGAAIEKMVGDKNEAGFKQTVDDMEAMVKDLKDAGVIDDDTYKQATDLIAAIRTGGVAGQDVTTKAGQLGNLLVGKLADVNADDKATALVGSGPDGLKQAADKLLGMANVRKAKGLVDGLVATGSAAAGSFGNAIATAKNATAFTKAVDDMAQQLQDLHDMGLIDDTTFADASKRLEEVRKAGFDGQASTSTEAAKLAANGLGTLVGNALQAVNSSDIAKRYVESGGTDMAVTRKLTQSVGKDLKNLSQVLGLARDSFNAFTGNLDGKYTDKLTQLTAGLDMLKESIDTMEAMGLITADQAKGFRQQADELRNLAMGMLTPGADRNALLTAFNDKLATMLGGKVENVAGKLQVVDGGTGKGLKTIVADAKVSDVVAAMTTSGGSAAMALRTANAANRNLMDTVMAHVADGGISATTLTQNSAVSQMLTSDPKLAGQFKLAMAERMANGGTVDFAAMKAAFGGSLSNEIMTMYNQVKGADLLTAKLNSGKQLSEADFESLYGKGLSNLTEDEQKELRKQIEKYNAGSGGGLFSADPATKLREAIGAAKDKAMADLQYKAAYMVGDQVLSNATGDKATFSLSQTAQSDLASAVATLKDSDASDFDKQQALATITGVVGNAGLGVASSTLVANAPTVASLVGNYMMGLGLWADKNSRSSSGTDATNAFDFTGGLGLKDSDILLGQDAFTKLGIVPAGMTPGSSAAALSQFLKGSYGSSGSGSLEAYHKLMTAIKTGDLEGAKKAYAELKNSFGSLVTRANDLKSDLMAGKYSGKEKEQKIAELQKMVDEMSAIQMLMPDVATQIDGTFHGKAGADDFVNQVKADASGAMQAAMKQGVMGAKRNGTTFETYRDAYQALQNGDIAGATTAIESLDKRAGDLQATVTDKLNELDSLRAAGKGQTMEYAKVMADLEAATLELAQITQMAQNLQGLTAGQESLKGLNDKLTTIKQGAAASLKSASVGANGRAVGLGDAGNQGALDDGRGVAQDQDAAVLLGKVQDFYDDIQDYLDNGDYGKAAQVIEEYLGKKSDMLDQMVQLMGADDPQVQALIKAKERIEKLIDPTTGKILDSGKMKNAVKDFMKDFRAADDKISDKYGTQEARGISSTEYSENAAQELVIRLSDGLRDRIEKALASKGGKLDASNVADVEALMQEAYADGLIGADDFNKLQDDFAAAKKQGDTYEFDKLMAKVNNIADRFEATAMVMATAGIKFEGALKALAKAQSGGDRRTAADNASSAIDDMEKSGIISADQAKALKTMVGALADGSEGDLRSDASAGEIMAARNEMANAIKVLDDLGLIDKETAGKLTVALGTADQAIMTGDRQAAIDAVNGLRGALRGAIQDDVIGKMADGSASAILKKMGANVEMEAADPKEAYDKIRRTLLTRAQDTVAKVQSMKDTDKLSQADKLAMDSAIETLALNGTITDDEAAKLRTALEAGDAGAVQKALAEVTSGDKSIGDRIAQTHLSAASTVMNRLGSTAQERGFIADLAKSVDDLFARLDANPKDGAARDELKTAIEQMKALGLVTATKADELEKAVMAGDGTAKAQLAALLSDTATTDTDGLTKALGSDKEDDRQSAAKALKDGIAAAVTAGKISQAQADDMIARIDKAAGGDKSVDLAALGRDLKAIGSAVQRFEAKFSADRFAGSGTVARQMRDLAFRTAQAAVAQTFFDNLAKVDLAKLQKENPAAFNAMVDQLRTQTKGLMEAGVLTEEFGTAMLNKLKSGDLKGLDKYVDRAKELVGTHQELIAKENGRNRDALGSKIADALAGDVDVLLSRLADAQAFNSAENRAEVMTELQKVIKRAEALAGTTGDTAVGALADELKKLQGQLDANDLKDVQSARLTDTAKSMTDIQNLVGNLRSHLETAHGVTLGGGDGGSGVEAMKRDAEDSALTLAQAILQDGKVDGSNLVLVGHGLEQDLDGLIAMDGADPELVKAAQSLDSATKKYEDLLKSPTATLEEKAKAKADLYTAIRDVEKALLKSRPGSTSVTVGAPPVTGTIPAANGDLTQMSKIVKDENTFIYAQGMDAFGNGEDAGDTPAMKMKVLKEQKAKQQREVTDARDNLEARLFGTGAGRSGEFHRMADYVATYIAFKGNDVAGTQKLDFKKGSADYNLAMALLTPDEQQGLLAKAATDPTAKAELAKLLQTRLKALDGLARGNLSLDQVKNFLKTEGLVDANLDAFLVNKGMLGGSGSVNTDAVKAFIMGDAMREAIGQQTKAAETYFGATSLTALNTWSTNAIAQFSFLKGSGHHKATSRAAAINEVAQNWSKSVQDIGDKQTQLDQTITDIGKLQSHEPSSTGSYTEALRLGVKSDTIDQLKAARGRGENSLTDAQIEEIGEIVSQLEQYRRQGESRDKLVDIAIAMGKSLDGAGLTGDKRTKALNTLMASVKAGLNGDLKQANANINAFIAKSLGAYLAVETRKAKEDFVKTFQSYAQQLSAVSGTLGDRNGTLEQQQDAELGFKVSQALDNLTEAQIRAAFEKFGGDAAKATEYLLSEQSLGAGVNGNLAASKVTNDLIGKENTWKAEANAYKQAFDMLQEKQDSERLGGRSTVNNFLANTSEEIEVMAIIAAHGGKLDESTWNDLKANSTAMAALKQAVGKDVTSLDQAVKAIGHMAARLSGQIHTMELANNGDLTQYFGAAVGMKDVIDKLALLDARHAKELYQQQATVDENGLVSGLTGDDFANVAKLMKQAHDEVGAFAKLNLKDLADRQGYANDMAKDAGDNLELYQSFAQDLNATFGTSEALKDVATLQKNAETAADTSRKEAAQDLDTQLSKAMELEEETGISVGETLNFKTWAADSLGFNKTTFVKDAAMEMAATLMKMLMSSNSNDKSTVNEDSIASDADKSGKDALKAQEEIRKKLEKLAKQLKEDRIAAEQADVKEYIKRLGKEYEVAAGNLILARKALSTAMASGNVAAAQAAMTALLSAAKTFESVKEAVKSLSERDAAANGGGDNHSQEFLAFKDSIKDLEKVTDQILNELKSGVLQEAVRKMGGTPQEKAEAMSSMGDMPGESVTKGMSTGAIVKQVLRRLQSDEIGGTHKKGSAKEDDDTLSADDVRTLFAFADGERVTSTKQGKQLIQDMIDLAGKAGNDGDPMASLQLASKIKKMLADSASDPTGTGINLTKQQRGALATLANVIEHNVSMMGTGTPDDDDKEVLRLQAGNTQLLLADVLRHNQGDLSDDTVVVKAGDPDKTATPTKTSDATATLSDRYNSAALTANRAGKQVDDLIGAKGKVLDRLDEIEHLLTPAELAAVSTDSGNGAEVVAKIRAAVNSGSMTGASGSAQELLNQLETALKKSSIEAKQKDPTTSTTSTLPTGSSSVTTTTGDDHLEPTNHKGGSGITMNDVMQSKGDLVNYDDLYALLPKMRQQSASGDLVTYDPRFAAVDQSKQNAILARANFDKAADAYYQSALKVQAAEGSQLAALDFERLATKGYDIAGLGTTNAKLSDAEMTKLKAGAQSLLDAKVNGQYVITDVQQRAALEAMAKGTMATDQWSALLGAAHAGSVAAGDAVKSAVTTMELAKKDMAVKQEVFTKADAQVQSDLETLRSGMGSGVLGGEYSMGGSLGASLDAYIKVLQGMQDYEADNASYDDVHKEQASKLEAGQNTLAGTRKELQESVKSDLVYLNGANKASQTTLGNKQSELQDVQKSITPLQTKIADLNKQQTDLTGEVAALGGYKSKVQDVAEAYNALQVAWATSGEVLSSDVLAKADALKKALDALPATAPVGADAGNLKALKDTGNILMSGFKDKNPNVVKRQLLETGQQNFGVQLNQTQVRLDQTMTEKNRLFELNANTLTTDTTVLGNLHRKAETLKKEIGDIAVTGGKDVPFANMATLSHTASGVGSGSLNAAADLDKIGTRLGASTVKANESLTVSDGIDGRALTARESRLIGEIDQMTKYKTKVDEAETFGSVGDKNAALNKVRKEMKATTLGDRVGNQREDKEQEIKKAYMSYLDAEMKVIDAKESGASKDTIRSLERDAKRLERQYNATNGKSWRDGLIAAFGGPDGKYALMAIKYGIELLMEAAKQERRVQELEALLAKAIKEEKALAMEMAMTAAGPRRA